MIGTMRERLRVARRGVWGWVGAMGTVLAVGAQEYGEPDRGLPGDMMIQSYLSREADRIHATMGEDWHSREAWETNRARFQQEYEYMLGLWPRPEKTPLRAETTGTLERDGYVVDMVHFQSRPGLYVTGNLYRPAEAGSEARRPAVLYVCGHSYQGRSGNKTAYQSHGIWLARHGYVCLMIDTLQLGEIEGLHHGTYRERRWSWHSRGYTPAGVEAWNGLRAIDYLLTRPDVDPERLAVTGISGGGAATFWIAALDSRVRAAAPVSGMADLPSYVGNRVINGHCDCMFVYNTFQWPWTRLAGLVAPRPLLFVNSDEDPIFPMDANDRVIRHLERIYSLYGKSHAVDALVSIGGHAYREDIRQGVYWFLNSHLRHDARPITDSEVDLVEGPRNDRTYPIPIDQLRVFPRDEDLPTDALNGEIDEHFVPLAEVNVPERAGFAMGKEALMDQLRRVVFMALPEVVPQGEGRQRSNDGREAVETELGVVIPVRRLSGAQEREGAGLGRLVLGVSDGSEEDRLVAMMEAQARAGDVMYVCQPRGWGATAWTVKNPPNYVRRSHVLLGQTEDTGRVRDVLAVAKYLAWRKGGKASAVLVGRGAAGLVAAYAALLDPLVQEVVVEQPPVTHLSNEAPQFLNVLRVADVPDLLGLLAPRALTLISEDREAWEKTGQWYGAAGVSGRLELRVPGEGARGR